MKHLESEIQRAFFRALSYHQEWRWIHSVPNAGKRGKAVAGIMKAEGMTAGVWDVHVPYPRQGYHGMYIEFKAGVNGLTKAQKEFGEAMEREGYRMEVHRDAFEAYQAVKKYMTGAF